MTKIKNECKDVKNGIELNEKDYCICLLTTLKCLITFFNVNLYSTSSPALT